jgi:DNA-binding IclR family transcriptional regulator
VLEVLAERSSDVSLVELAKSMDIPKGSLFRHLKVLEARGFVRQIPETKQYELGARLIYLGFAARRRLRLAEIAEPTMIQLRDRYNETVHLAVLSQFEVVHVATVESGHPVKMACAVGDRTWAHVSALGKALLAWSSPDVIKKIVQERGLPVLTEHTVRTWRELEEELESTRRRGYAVDDEESAIGLRCVAAPICDETAAPVSALSLSAPAERLALDDAHAAASDVQEAAKTISARLGWRTPDRRAEQLSARRGPREHPSGP